MCKYLSSFDIIWLVVGRVTPAVADEERMLMAFGE